MSDLRNPFYTEATEHPHRALSLAGHRIVVLTDPPDRPLAPDELLDGSFDGAVLATSVLGSALPVVLQQRGLPLVLFNRAIDAAELDVCVSDNVGGASEVAHELVRLGHRRIGAIFGPANTTTGRDREAGFRAGLAANGVVLDEGVVRRGPFSERDGYGLMGELLATDPMPSAVFCANDVIALGALNAAAAMGIAIPGDISVVGFDDIAAAGWDITNLTTVRQDLAGMARVSVELLLERVAGARRAPRQVIVPTRLIRRGSLRSFR